MGIGEDLDLDVAGLDDRLLEVDGAVAERGGRLGARQPERRLELSRGRHEPHALPAAAPGRLDHHREAQVLRGPAGLRIRSHRFRGPGHDRHARLDGRAARRGLVAHPGDRRGRRAHEHEARGAARLGEGRVLGQEAVAGMDRLGARPAGDRDQAIDQRGSSRSPGAGRSGAPRRPAGRGARPDPPRRRRPPCGCRRPGTRGSRAPRSRPGWRSGACRTSRPASSDLARRAATGPGASRSSAASPIRAARGDGGQRGRARSASSRNEPSTRSRAWSGAVTMPALWYQDSCRPTSATSSRPSRSW